MGSGPALFDPPNDGAEVAQTGVSAVPEVVDFWLMTGNRDKRAFPAKTCRLPPDSSHFLPSDGPFCDPRQQGRAS